jgi:hypothetical protein
MIDPYRGSPFSHFAKGTAHATGHPIAFVVAVLIVLTWAITGPSLRLQRYVAVGDQHRHNHRHVPDGLLDSEYPESG